MKRYTWSDHALCKEQTDRFFAPDGEAPRERIAREAQAKAICANCTVQSDCLDAAITGDERGIWGGTTEAERRRMVRRTTFRRRPPSMPSQPQQPVRRDASWRTVQTRPNTVGIEIRLAITEGGTAWHGFTYAVFRADDLAFLADTESDAWMYFQTLVVA